MQNMTFELDHEQGTPCPFCGEIRPMRKIPCSFTSDGWMNIGVSLCDCEEAKAERERIERDEAEKQQREALRKRKERLERAGVPLRYRDALHPDARYLARQVNNGESVFIYGPNGTGKTTLAMATVRFLLSYEVDAFCLSTYDLMDAMRSRKDEDRALFDRATSCGVLVLDDLGKEASNTPYACERLFAIIDKRDKEMKPVIITSNYKLSELAKNITEGDVGVAIASRLKGSCKQVPLEGEDRRLTRG